jgi:hypothetical protein
MDWRLLNLNKREGLGWVGLGLGLYWFDAGLTVDLAWVVTRVTFLDDVLLVKVIFRYILGKYILLVEFKYF